jgi:hypothetical protein
MSSVAGRRVSRYADQLFNLRHVHIAAALLFGPSAGAITAVDGLVLSARMEKQSFSGPCAVQYGGGHLRCGRRRGSSSRSRKPSAARWSVGRAAPLTTLLLFGALVSVSTAESSRWPSASTARLDSAIWREHLAGVWLTYFGGIFAMLVMLLARFRPLETLILIVPLPVICT